MGHPAISWSAVAGAILVAGFWQGLVLAAVTGAVVRCAPRASASLRFLLWIAALGCAILLPIAEALSSLHAPAAVGTPVWRADARWSLALATLWLAASAARGARLWREAMRLRRLRVEARPVGCSEPLRRLLHSGQRAVSLRHCPEMDRPGVVGLRQPCILLPSGIAERLDEAELEQVILHELEHLRRRDDWFNLLQKLSLVLLPLSPALLWIDRRLCFERELACDEGVVERLREPRSYASLLAKLAEYGLERRMASLVLGAMARPSQLARRVHRILETRQPVPRGERYLAPAALAVVLAFGSISLAHCPELVEFGRPVAGSVMTTRDLAAATPHVVYRERPLAAAVVQAALPTTARPAGVRPRKARTRRATRTERVQIAEMPSLLPSLAVHLEVPLEAPVEAPQRLLVEYRLVRIDGGWLLIQL